MSLPAIPRAVRWSSGMVLEPAHFRQTDRRSAELAHLAALTGEPWPWGFLRVEIDETALASAELRVRCEGVFPAGEPFSRQTLSQRLPDDEDVDVRTYHVDGGESDTRLTLRSGNDAPARTSLPVARLVRQGGVWSRSPGWSPPAMLIDADHPVRDDLNRQLGALAALGSGFMATLRLPGAEERAAARRLGQVASVIAQGVGVMEALLAAPAVSPSQIGIEALRLALGVRGAAGVFEPLHEVWDPSDQRGSMRRLLQAAESTASAMGLPFRAYVFRRSERSDVLYVDGVPGGTLLLGVETGRPTDLVAARAWLEGAALAAPDRIDDALTRRVAGCARRPVERDPTIGVSSGPMLALYHVSDDMAWRGGQCQLGLGAKTSPPPNTSFLVFIPEEIAAVGIGHSAPAQPADPTPKRARWAGVADGGGSR